MKLLIINPNTTTSMTSKIESAALAVAGPDTELRAVNPNMGPATIEGYYDEAFSVPGLIEEIREAEASGFDAFVIACFDDTGLDAARTVATGPVLGICEAGMHVASMLGTRFSVVTTLSRSIPPLEALARRYGMHERCRVRAADVPVLDLEDETSDAVEHLRGEIRKAIDEDAAECVLLGCAGMTHLAEILSEEFSRPVLDGLVCAVKLAEALVHLGLRTSKIGGYAYPLPKAYAGELARFGPKR